MVLTFCHRRPRSLARLNLSITRGSSFYNDGHDSLANEPHSCEERQSDSLSLSSVFFFSSLSPAHTGDKVEVCTEKDKRFQKKSNFDVIFQEKKFSFLGDSSKEMNRGSSVSPNLLRKITINRLLCVGAAHSSSSSMMLKFYARLNS